MDTGLLPAMMTSADAGHGADWRPPTGSVDDGASQEA